MHIEELTTKDRDFVRSWRYVNREALILDFSQPKPPAGFAVHKGGWRFREVDPGRTALVSYHGFALEPEADGAEAVALIRAALAQVYRRSGRTRFADPGTQLIRS